MAGSNRRNFLRQLSLLSAAAGTSLPAKWVLETDEKVRQKQRKKTTKIGIFQTTDVHCQIHPHDEMFWENEEWFSERRVVMWL